MQFAHSLIEPIRSSSPDYLTLLIFSFVFGECYAFAVVILLCRRSAQKIVTDSRFPAPDYSYCRNDKFVQFNNHFVQLLKESSRFIAMPPHPSGTPPKEGNKKSTSLSTDAFVLKKITLISFW